MSVSVCGYMYLIVALRIKIINGTHIHMATTPYLLNILAYREHRLVNL